MEQNTNPTTQINEISPISDRYKFARDEKLALVEVDCAAVNLPAPGGFILNHGLQRLRISDRHVATLQTMVRSEEDARDYASAQEQFARELKKFCADKLTDCGYEPDEPEYRRIKRGCIESFPRSAEAIFFENRERDGKPHALKPLRSVTVIESGIVNPDDEERLKTEAHESAVMAAAIAKAVGQPASGSDEKLIETIARVVNAMKESKAEKGR